MTITKTTYLYSLVVAAILVLAVLLRFAYIGFAYEQADEQVATQVIKYMERTGHWDTNWKNTDLPAFYRYDQYNFSSYIYSLYVFAKVIHSFHLYSYRLFSVILSSLVIVTLLLLARTMREAEVGIWAAFLAAIAPILVQDAHYARPEAFLSCLTLWVIYLCWPRENPRFGFLSSYIAPFLIGFLAACKVTMLFLVWIPLVPLVYGLQRGVVPKKRLPAYLARVAIFTICGFVLGVPGVVENLRGFGHPQDLSLVSLL